MNKNLHTNGLCTQFLFLNTSCLALNKKITRHAKKQTDRQTDTHTHTHNLKRQSKLFQNWEVTGHMFKYLHETCFKANPWPFVRMINVGSYFLCEDKSFYPQWYQSKLSVANLSGYGYMNGPSLVVCFLLWIFIFIFLERFLLYILGNWHYLL